MRNKTNHYKVSSIITCIIISIFPILYMYPFYIEKIGTIVLFFYTLFQLFCKKFIVFSKKILAFFCLTSILQIVCVIQGTYSSTMYFKALIHAIICCLCISIFTYINDLNLFYIIYKFIGVISMIAIFFQSFQVYVLGKLVSAITFIPVLSYDGIVQNYYRPCGFFSEPSAYATYILPLIAWTLLEKTDIMFTLLLSVSVVLSSSTSGIIMLTFIWFIYFSTKSVNFKKKVICFFAILLLAIAILQIPQFGFITSKLMNMGSSVSDFTRLTKGWITFSELPLFEKIFGIGFNNLTNYMQTTGKHFSWLNITDLLNPYRWQYMNTLFGVLVEFGIIISSVFYYDLISFLKKKQTLRNTLIILFFLLTCCSSTLYNGTFIFYFSIYFTLSHDESTDFLKFKLDWL